LPISG